MSSVWPTVVMCLLYVLLVKVVGPRVMRTRNPPPHINTVIIAYNLFQTLFSLWGFSEGWK